MRKRQSPVWAVSTAQPFRAASSEAMKSFYLLGIALTSRFDCLTGRMATDSKDTDLRIGPSLVSCAGDVLQGDTTVPFWAVRQG
jgi:hypothetical protein